MPQVLVIDDEPALRQILAAALSRAGYLVDVAAGVREAKARLAKGDVDVAICDITMPDGNGVELLRDTRNTGIETPFIMVTAMTSVDTAVTALRAGAFDYLIKPVRTEELLHRVGQIDAIRGLQEANDALRKVLEEKSSPVFQFTSPAMAQVNRLVGKVAPTDSTVLITGESGTGKGVLARSIHALSERSKGSFVAVNCGAIPEHLMESECFGHVKGAFTGADKGRKGLFMEADKGTLFLDEIGELPMPMQVKLLHAIEDKKIRSVGSEESRPTDTRIVAATNRNLETMVAEGLFREDLFFRLSMFQISIPPLRSRSADIDDLIKFMLATDNNRHLRIDPAVMDCLRTYQWPGNVREVENVITRASILAENGCITVGDLPTSLVKAVSPQAKEGCEGENLRQRLRRMETEIIKSAVEAAGGDLRRVALELGVSVSTLYRKMGGTCPGAAEKAY